jgi:hypothetical protein
MKKMLLLVLIWQSCVVAADESDQLLVPLSKHTMSVGADHKKSFDSIDSVLQNALYYDADQIGEADLIVLALEDLEAYRKTLDVTRDAIELEHTQTAPLYCKKVGAATAPPLLCGMTCAAIGGVWNVPLYAMLCGIVSSTPFSVALVRNVQNSYHTEIDARIGRVTVAIDKIDNAIRIKKASATGL